MGEVSTEVDLVYRAEALKMWRALVGFTGNREIADDAVAEAFARAIRDASSIRDLRAWTWAVAFRIASAELRDRGYPLDTQGRPEEPSDSVPELVRALRVLPTNQRLALVLHDCGTGDGWNGRVERVTVALGVERPLPPTERPVDCRPWRRPFHPRRVVLRVHSVPAWSWACWSPSWSRFWRSATSLSATETAPQRPAVVRCRHPVRPVQRRPHPRTTRSTKVRRRR